MSLLDRDHLKTTMRVASFSNKLKAKADNTRAEQQIEWKKETKKGKWRTLAVADEEDCATKMRACGIETKDWGKQGKTKALSFLLAEVAKGLCVLQTTSTSNDMDQGAKIRRSMKVAKVKVMRGNQVLVEAKEVQLVSSKVKMDEEPQEAALRGLFQEIGELLPNPKIGHKVEIHHESKFAPSYPGLLGYCEYFTVEADGSELPSEDFQTVDKKTAQTHFWSWRPIEEWNRIAREKRELLQKKEASASAADWIENRLAPAAQEGLQPPEAMKAKNLKTLDPLLQGGYLQNDDDEDSDDSIDEEDRGKIDRWGLHASLKEFATQHHQLRSIFQYFDLDNDGYLAVDEAYRVATMLGVQFRPDFVMPNSHKGVSVRQLSFAMFSAVRDRPNTNAEAFTGFARSIANSEGLITRRKFEMYLHLIRFPMEKDLIDDLFWLVNKNLKTDDEAVHEDDLIDFMLRVYVPSEGYRTHAMDQQARKDKAKEKYRKGSLR